MISEANPANGSVAAQIHALAQAAYTLEAERIGCGEFPPLRESLDELCQSSDRFLVCRQLGVFAGALSYVHSTASVTITRLVVRPTHLRQGIATALLTELERRVAPVAHFTVSTAQRNIPAITLYQRLGYLTGSASISPEGIPLLHLTKCR